MTDYQVPASAIEAAARAASGYSYDVAGETTKRANNDRIERALRAAFDELGMTLESDYGDEKEARRVERLVSRWMPVNGVVEKP